jgi:hypothetical protein
MMADKKEVATKTEQRESGVAERRIMRRLERTARARNEFAVHHVARASFGIRVCRFGQRSASETVALAAVGA